MGQPQAKRKNHKGNKMLSERFRLKNKTKDIDEIHDDMVAKKAVQLLKQDIDLDIPGNAQFYCLHCALV